MIILFLGVIANPSHAQTININLMGELIYVRRGPEIVSWSNQTRQVFDVREVFAPAGDFCWTISEEGTYIAYSTMSASPLIIRRIDTQQIVIQETWANQWSPCNFRWASDTVLAIEELNSQSVPRNVFYFDISGGTLAPYNLPPYNPPPFPALPNGSPDLFFLPAPQGNLYLYETCNGEVTFNENLGYRCSTRSNLVIYDLSEQEIIHTITDTNASNIICCTPGLVSARWSPDGRYLAYDRTLPPPGIQPEDFIGFFLRIYDTQTRQYLNTNFGIQRKDPFHSYAWSPYGNKLAVWILGDLRTESENMRTLLIFDVLQNAFVVVNTPYRQPAEIFWSPDNAAISFIEEADQYLIYVDASSGTASVMDTDVVQIISWHTN